MRVIHKYWQIILGMLPTLIGVYFAIVKLAPDEVGRLRFRFVLSFIKHAFPDILIVLFLYALVWAWFRLERYRKNYISLLRQTNNYKWVLFLFVSISVLFAAVNMRNFYYIGRARVFHYLHLYESYRFDLYKEMAGAINSLDYKKALVVCNEIQADFPQDTSDIEPAKNELKNRMRYAQYFSNTPNGPDMEEWSAIDSSRVDRKKLYKLLTTFAFAPNHQLREEITHVAQKLKEGQQVASEYYDDYANNDSVSCSKMLKDWGWYLYEPEILDLIYTKGSGVHPNILAKYMGNRKREDYLDELKNAWMIPGIDTLLSWQPMVYNGKSRDTGE